MEKYKLTKKAAKKLCKKKVLIFLVFNRGLREIFG